MTLADYQKDPNRIGTDFIKYYYTKLSTNSSKIYQLYTKDAVCKHMNPTSDPFKNQAEEIHGIEKIKKYWKSQPPISNAKIVILTVNTIQNSDGSLVITVVGEILLREDYDSDDDTILPTRTFTQTFILQQHAVKDNFEVKSDILTYIPNTDYMNAVIYEEEEPVELVVVEEEEEFPEKGGRGALRDVGEAPEEDAEGEETKKQKGKYTHLTGSEMEESTAPGGIYNKSQAETNNKQKAVSTLEEDVNSTEGSVKKTSNINKPASTPQPKSEVSISTKEITPEAGKTKVASQSGAVSGAATSLPSVSAASASASVSNDQNHPLSPPSTAAQTSSESSTQKKERVSSVPLSGSSWASALKSNKFETAVSSTSSSHASNSKSSNSKVTQDFEVYVTFKDASSTFSESSLRTALAKANLSPINISHFKKNNAVVSFDSAEKQSLALNKGKVNSGNVQINIEKRDPVKKFQKRKQNNHKNNDRKN
ncbi:hypothetical protein CAS74_004255 [Pichia kudriavzevii]|uniref:NTF2 domain-containing protein n=1 Tax=Pichia kudriavzevii TaxID=4909 RepID=A0A1Z8JJI4_PICKU|nr:hypothetical protein CAS74_004255 [Pichia kudriavzevii]